MITIKVRLKSDEDLERFWERNYYELLGSCINLHNQFGKGIWQYLVISKRSTSYNPAFSLTGVTHTKSLTSVQGNM